MVYRISGGIFLALLGLGYLGIYSAPAIALGILALVAGIALLAGQ